MRKIEETVETVTVCSRRSIRGALRTGISELHEALVMDEDEGFTEEELIEAMLEATISVCSNTVSYTEIVPLAMQITRTAYDLMIWEVSKTA